MLPERASTDDPLNFVNNLSAEVNELCQIFQEVGKEHNGCNT